MMQVPNMGLWAGLNAATVFENGVYFGTGIFDVEIVRCLSKQTQKSGLAFIVECEVLTSTNPEHPAGSKRTWFQSMKNTNVGFGAVAGFLLAVFGLENNTARKQDFFPYLELFMGRVTGPENVLSGVVVHVECTMIKTQAKFNQQGVQISGGTDFTRHDWSAFDYDGARSVGLDLSPPRWGDYMRALPSGPAAPSYAAAPPLPGSAPHLSPDGRHQLINNQWVPYSPQLPPPPPPPPAARNPWEMPGAQITPDGCYYLLGNNVWQKIPGR